MIAELRLIIECTEEFNVNMGSLFQGVLMEQIDGNYASTLHNQGIKPYSQSLLDIHHNKAVWTIRTLSDEAYENIIVPLCKEEFSSFCINHNQNCVKIIQKKLKKESEKNFIKEFYELNSQRFFTIEFLTPTAFKKDGRYFFWPDIGNIFFSIMNKYDANSARELMFSKETLEQIYNTTEIVSYKIQSCKYNLEGVKIPSFKGRITIKVSGTQTMINFVRLLLKYGNYSGIGIKTAMGMGCVHAYEGRGGNLIEEKRN